MAWTDRIRQAAYTPPSGTRFNFSYEDVGYSRTKKTTEFEFPDANGTFVQESGSTGRSYPLQCIFWGPECDREADAFDAALFERGTGKLDHPMYGTVDVVPTGTITRRDDLKSSANQVIIEVTFVATIGLSYPSSQSDPSNQVLASVTDFNQAQALEFSQNIGLNSTFSVSSFRGQFEFLLNQSVSDLRNIAKTTADILTKFNLYYDSLTRGLSTLTSDPETLALQTAFLIQVPTEATSSPIATRLSTYSTLAAELTSETTDTPQNFYTRDLFASLHVTGAILSTVYNNFETRASAISAAVFVLDLFEAVNKWKDNNIVVLGVFDTGAAYQQLQKAVALTAGYLVEISFTAKQERRIVLDRARTIVDLTAQLYGSVDPYLDYFIASNDLSGSEILELPRGREIVYYV